MATYECSLAGLIIGTAEKDAILQRLVGICGNEAMIDLFEHEMIFSPSGRQKAYSLYTRMLLIEGMLFE